VEKANANVEAKNNDGWTPLHYAAWNGHIDAVQYLVEKANANVEAKDDIYGSTPLHYAAEKGHVDAMQYLVEKANANVEAKDNDRCTPLQCAAWNGHIDVVQYLMEKANANVEAMDNYRWTPLHRAAQAGHVKNTQFQKMPSAKHFFAPIIAAEIPCDVVTNSTAAIIKEKVIQNSCGNGYLAVECNIKQNINFAGTNNVLNIYNREMKLNISPPSSCVESEMKYRCLYCKKEFKQKSNIEAHVPVHTGSRPFNCNVCNKAFSQKSNLNRHFESSSHVKNEKRYAAGMHFDMNF